jgi:predicted outer membrane protein
MQIAAADDAMLARQIRNAILELARAINDATELIRQHYEQRRDARKKDRGNRGLDDMRDGFSAGLLQRSSV